MKISPITEFTFTRFPVFKDYTGWALFIDCDFIFKQDVADLFALADDICSDVPVMIIPKEGENGW